MRPPSFPTFFVLLAVLFALATAIHVVRSPRTRHDDIDELPLERLKGFHIFGPEEDDEPVVHVPVLRTRPVVSQPGTQEHTSAHHTTAESTKAEVAAHRSAAPRSAVSRTAPVEPARRGSSPAVSPPTSAAQPASHPALSPPLGEVPARAAETRPAAELRPAHADADPAPGMRATAPALRYKTLPPLRPATPPPIDCSPASVPTPALPATPARPPRQRGELPFDGDVLLVEDDVTLASLYGVLLRSKGYAVRHAQDGLEGIAMVRDQRPALILLDMMMPRMDGLQFLEALRGWPKTSALPVVVLSNADTRDLVDRALALGAVDYLVKAQTRPQVIAGALPHWLRGNRALSAMA